MTKDGICTSALYIEMWRWFTEKLTKWTNEHQDYSKWVDVLKDSHVYCQEEDELGNPTGKWYRITGIVDHGPNVTLKICKPNGKIEL